MRTSYQHKQSQHDYIWESIPNFISTLLQLTRAYRCYAPNKLDTSNLYIVWTPILLNDFVD